jgi:hypothetical protein
MTFRLAILFLTALCCSYAQVTSTSTLSGTVADPLGALVPGAVVIVKNTETGATYHASTSSNGAFSVPSLGTGTYSVTVTAAGFKAANIADIKLDAGVPTAVQVRLEIGSQGESVTVQADAAVLQTQSTARRNHDHRPADRRTPASLARSARSHA